jgi:L-aminopeptidase/D-esterase-like protein
VDGDTFFVLGTGGAAPPAGPVNTSLALEAAVADVVVQAVLRSVRLARSAGGAPGLAG